MVLEAHDSVKALQQLHIATSLCVSRIHKHTEHTHRKELQFCIARMRREGGVTSKRSSLLFARTNPNNARLFVGGIPAISFELWREPVAVPSNPRTKKYYVKGGNIIKTIIESCQLATCCHNNLGNIILWLSPFGITLWFPPLHIYDIVTGDYA